MGMGLRPIPHLSARMGRFDLDFGTRERPVIVLFSIPRLTGPGL